MAASGCPEENEFLLVDDTLKLGDTIVARWGKPTRRDLLEAAKRASIPVKSKDRREAIIETIKCTIRQRLKTRGESSRRLKGPITGCQSRSLQTPVDAPPRQYSPRVKQERDSDDEFERDLDSDNVKQAYFHHLNHDVYVRPGNSGLHGVGSFAIKDIPPNTNFSKSIPGAREKDSVILKREEIEDFVQEDEVKRFIYDMFPPSHKHDTDRSEDIFTLPAQGMNDLPSSYFMNASHRGYNVHSSEDRDSKGYAVPKTRQEVRKGQEVLWPSCRSRAIQSAEDYDLATDIVDKKTKDEETKKYIPAPFVVDDDTRDDETQRMQLQERINQLEKQNAALHRKLQMGYRPLCPNGSDVDKTGIAYFKQDDQWVDIRLVGFTSKDEREDGATRGLYKFYYDVREEDGKLAHENNGSQEMDFDLVSVEDTSVRVQDESWNPMEIDE